MTPKEAHAARKTVCMSVDGFAKAIGYQGKDGARTILAMEAGVRHGKPFSVSGPAAAAIGYLLAINQFIRAHDAGEDLSQAVAALRMSLPESIR